MSRVARPGRVAHFANNHEIVLEEAIVGRPGEVLILLLPIVRLHIAHDSVEIVDRAVDEFLLAS